MLEEAEILRLAVILTLGRCDKTHATTLTPGTWRRLREFRASARNPKRNNVGRMPA